ncbi:MAG: YjbH domain-containing protein [Ramlibacter sp.]|nr:YjbH domain-containing protein [Ramlibacter sp.]
MRSAPITLLAAVLSVVPSFARAQPTTLTQAGYTGLGITPNAHLLGWGRAETTYDSQLPGVVRDPTGHNFVVGFGLLPNLEIAGRLATNSLNRNCFFEGCGVRDLSASGKVGIGLDTANRFRVAAGVTDVGGAATFFRLYYGVLTFNEGPVEASAGLAKRSSANFAVSTPPLDGPFAAVAWQPLPWVRGQLEYTDGNAWAGVRLFAPAQWLPEGWQVYAGANLRLNDNNLTRRSWFSAGISIPLYKVPELRGSGPKAPLPALAGAQRPLPSYEARTLSPPAVLSPAPAASSDVPDSKLHELASALQDKGLEDISVGRMPDGSLAVRANNATYNWNSADALGAALGAVARTLGDAKAGYRLILTQRQTALVGVTGQTDCLRQWINNDAAACAGGQLSTPGTGALEALHQGVAWAVRNVQPSSQTLRVAISPVLRTEAGTDVGALDYSAGVNVGLQLPLWDGASVEWRRNVPLANSSDYEPDGVFGFLRVRAETERLAFVQTVRVPLERWLAPGNDLQAMRWGLAGLTAQATVGRVGSRFDGVHGALRWEPGEGRHRVTAQTGYFRNARFEAGGFNVGPRQAKPLLASYRYSVTPTRTYLEATGGQFMNNDLGFQVSLRQWFSDFSVNTYYRRTRFSGEPVRQFVGLEISLPIGPRRDMAPTRHVQITGTPRFTHGEESLVRETNNAIRPGFGVVPPTPSLDATFNSDRAGLVYFEDNIRRIRDAAR